MIAEWDKQPGAHINMKAGAPNEDVTTYVYYNGGGRYPWDISAKGDTISINLYSDDKLSAKEGYCLIRITHPLEYGSVKVYLDGKLMNGNS